MKIIDYIMKYKAQGKNRIPRIICNDGFSMSVQVSEGHYCTPRRDRSSWYETAEVGFPSEVEERLIQYAEEKDRPLETVYGWVPLSIIDEIVSCHGGISNIPEK